MARERRVFAPAQCQPARAGAPGEPRSSTESLVAGAPAFQEPPLTGNRAPAASSCQAKQSGRGAPPEGARYGAAWYSTFDETCEDLPIHWPRESQYASALSVPEVCKLKWEWEVRVPELSSSVFIIPNGYVKNSADRLVVLNRVALSRCLRRNVTGRGALPHLKCYRRPSV